jgi:hypothetical protein
MNFNKHSNLEGRHAFLSASKYHWLNYDEEKLISSYQNFLSIQRGTDLHDFAKRCIELGIKLPKSKKTLNMYVNDAIGFQMTPEQPLYFSENCFGTADSISFRNNILRIHDLKTGMTPAHMEQLYIYEALFCLEYGVDPNKIENELRIYQFDDVLVENPDPKDIKTIMDKIVFFDNRLSIIQEGV